MSDLLNCVLYLAAIGCAFFLLGRILPKNILHEDRFPFRSFQFEQDGKIYNQLHIKQWQKKVPDMSRILPHAMPAKRLGSDFADHLPLMIKETCVAELVHWLLSLLGLSCLNLWPGLGGAIVTALYIVFGNLPFIIIQRYNRPRLMRLMKKSGRAAQQDEQSGAAEAVCGL